MKLIFAGVLLLHGLIHLMGFLKAFGLADLPQLMAISRPVGLLWLLAMLLFGLTAGWLLSGSGNWWLAALPAVLLSQAVILLSWQDARFGTLANLMVLAVAGLSLAQARFVNLAEQEVRALLPASLAPASPVRAEELRALPAPVRNWLEHAGMIGKPRIQTVHLHQQGEMRTRPDGAWMPVTAEEYFNVERPGFSWLARVRMLPLLELLGRDKYAEGKGEMLIKALGLIPVADAKGASTDQGTMLRYLAEICWFPSAALAPYLSWEGLDATSARATMTYGGISASAVFYFSPEGDFQRLEARRYYDRPTGATLEDWLIEAESYRDFEGIRIPDRSSVSWRLKEGLFTWFRLSITELDYNVLPARGS